MKRSRTAEPDQTSCLELPRPMSSSIRSEKEANLYIQRVIKNTKILRELETKLNSDRQEVYIDAANKLVRWLDDDKAYYLEGRPHIVSLLETATYTLARLLGLKQANDFHISRCTPELQPRAAAFVALVQTVKPYLPLFPEEHFKTRLITVFSMIHVSPPVSQPTLESSAPALTGPSSSVGDANNISVRPTVVSLAGMASVSSQSSTSITPTNLESTSPQIAYMNELANAPATQNGSLNAGQPSLPHDSPTTSLVSSPTRSKSEDTMPFVSASPISIPSPIPIATALTLRKARFPGLDIPMTSMETQFIHGANHTPPPAASSQSPHPQSASISSASFHTVSSPSKPASPAQQIVSPTVSSPSATYPADIARASSSPTLLNRAPYSTAKFALLAALDKKSWQKGSQPKAVLQEQGYGQEKERLKSDDRDVAYGVSKAIPNETKASVSTLPTLGVQISYEQAKVSPSADPTTSIAPDSQFPHTPVTSSPADIKDVSASTTEPTHQIFLPQAQENTHHQEPVHHTPNETTKVASTPHVPTEKRPRLQPLTESMDPLASTPGNVPTGQEAISVPLLITPPDVDETPMFSATGGDQAKSTTPCTRMPPHSEVDVSKERVSTTQAGHDVPHETLVADGGSDTEAREVEQVVIPAAGQRRSTSVAAPSCVAEPVVVVEGQEVPHGHASVAHNQPDATHASAIRSASPREAPVETPSSPSAPSAKQTSSVAQSRDTPGPVDTAPEPVPTPVTKPADGSGSRSYTMSDIDAYVVAHRRALVALTQRLKMHGNADSQSRVDGMVAHMPASPRPRGLAVDEAAGEVLGLRGRQREEEIEEGEIISKGSADEVAGEGEGKGANGWEGPPQESRVGEASTVRTGAKRAWSMSSDGLASEHVSNKPRKEKMAETDVKESSSAEARTASDVRNKDKVGDMLDSISTPTKRDGRIAGSKMASEHSCTDAPDLDSESRHPSSFRDEDSVFPRLPACSYHPTQPYETIAVVVGSPMAGTQDVQFELDEAQAALVKKWTGRFENFEPDTPCMSFTLICMHMADGQKSGEDTTRDVEIRWPSGGNFWIIVEADDRTPVSISVSPPAWIKPYEPLDVSSLVGRGRTKMRFTQTADHAQYCFELRAHRPTAAQLRSLDVKALAARVFARFTAPFPAHLKRGLFSSSEGSSSQS